MMMMKECVVRYKTTNWERMEMSAKRVERRVIDFDKKKRYLKTLDKLLVRSGEAIKLGDLITYVRPKLKGRERQSEYTYVRGVLRGVKKEDKYRLIKVGDTLFVVKK